ncbi:methyl-accepting chemotaxis protein [Shewanella sp. C32]|uniref:Methyl-accepting chemotaxis protein n=1 Tax=Shewanella electrica TaxID=515560 RepID=A0ABT2FLC6_9GAMM|nr:methyl-accepting chemotaxis protein [Shewanella electrica]MCH1925556.1 methyl-accepting chemotaxis protein [Shewanella electrica]MCS4557137.1 methyl-accepting chemotaxis protein [Shewanella electrica]
MKNLGIRQKILLLAVLPLILLTAVILFISWQMESQTLTSTVNDFREKLIHERKQEMIHVTEIAREMVAFQRQQGVDFKEQLRTAKFGESGYFYIYDGQGRNVFHGLTIKLEGTDQIGMTDPKGIKIVQGLLQSAATGDGFLTYFFQKPGSTELIEKLGYVAKVPGTDWIIGTGAYFDDIDAAAAEYRDMAQQEMLTKLWAVVVITLILAAVTVVVIMLAASKMVKPLNNMLEHLNDIAKGEGDLTRRVPVNGQDEIAAVGRAFNLFVEKLQHTIRDVAQSTGQVVEAAHNIHTQTEAIASQLANHNHETDQVVTAITEMSSTAQEVAANTNEVADSTHDATNEVAKAQRCVDDSLTQVSSLMEEIDSAAVHVQALNEQSQKINSVLSVIGGIAEQTNLLALNAAIEAARAGEQGRGFAVVADEVRNLASRTQASTLEINEMLNELNSSVSRAVAAMDKSQKNCQQSVSANRLISESLGAVTSSVTRINDMSTQIATATTEQSSVTEEINRNIYVIQEIVTALMAASQSAATVSQSVSSSGDKLGHLVRQFKI